MSRYVTAIDIGTSKVVTLVGEQTSSGIKIIAYSEGPSQGVSRGEIVNIKKALDSLIPTIESVKDQLALNPDAADYHIYDVYVGISGQNIRSFNKSLRRNRSNQSELISDREVLSMLEEMYNSKVEPTEQIHYIVPQSYNVDERMGETEIAGMDGKEIEGDYKLFVGRLSTVKQCTSVINRARLNVKKFILKPIATAEAILSEDEKELGCAIADIGGGSTGLTIYYNNIVRHAAIIPFGGNSISEDIRMVCGVSLKNAEILKTAHGTCVSEFAQENKFISIMDKSRGTNKQVAYKLLASAIEARMCEILATIRHEIEQSGYMDKVGTLIFTGGGAQMMHLRTLAKAVFGDMEIKVATAEDKITRNSADAASEPGASTAVGLVIKGFEYESILPEAPTTIFPIEDIDTPAAGAETSGDNTPPKTGGQKKKWPWTRNGGKTLDDFMTTIFASSADDNDA